ncbi:MAG TPA: DUF6448 family protein [Myxococcota bacterium]|nr:DUF6448 family protein [Myxococcota bacterium]HRY94610.1 DUF6448 family protein [Myxococcota bacterium]HSA20234.1 DUF6448 family protein [Myxococcota bacterium]
MRENTRLTNPAWVLGTALLLLTAAAGEARAHCDTPEGPVLVAARAALERGEVNRVLIWVQPGDEAALRAEFDRAQAARRAGGQEQEVAERRFLETLVRLHRQGEGAPYTGIKPAGLPVPPAVAAADQALARGELALVSRLVPPASQAGLEELFRAALARRQFSADDLAAGRAYVKAYVEYVHFVEGGQAHSEPGHAHGQPARDGHPAGHGHAEGGAR